MSFNEDDILVGKVVAPFGTRGEVKVVSMTDFPERFEVGETVVLIGENRERVSLAIKASREQKEGFILFLDGVNSRQEADALRGTFLVIDKSELGDLPEQSYYIFDIVGMAMSTDDGRELGTITEVIQTGANDVYVTDAKICVPALKSVVVKVDVPGKTMVIHPMPGLLPEK